MTGQEDRHTMTDTAGHPSSDPNPWTDEDVQAAVLAIWEVAQARPTLTHKMVRAVLAALAPRLVERERAAAAKALRDHAAEMDNYADLADEQARGTAAHAYRWAAKDARERANGVTPCWHCGGRDFHVEPCNGADWPRTGEIERGER